MAFMFFLFAQCFPSFPNQISVSESHLFCHLQILWIWTGLKICCLVKSSRTLGRIQLAEVNEKTEAGQDQIAGMCSLILIHTFSKISLWSQLARLVLTLYQATVFRLVQIESLWRRKKKHSLNNNFFFPSKG